jgi:cobalamin biosynthesis protein CobT
VQKIAFADTGIIREHYSEIKSFLKSTWFQIPDQQAKSRIMRPRFAERNFGSPTGSSDKIQDQEESDGDNTKQNEAEQDPASDKSSIATSAVYVSDQSDLTHTASPSLTYPWRI